MLSCIEQWVMYNYCIFSPYPLIQILPTHHIYIFTSSHVSLSQLRTQEIPSAFLTLFPPWLHALSAHYNTIPTKSYSALIPPSPMYKSTPLIRGQKFQSRAINQGDNNPTCVDSSTRMSKFLAYFAAGFRQTSNRQCRSWGGVKAEHELLLSTPSHTRLKIGVMRVECEFLWNWKTTQLMELYVGECEVVLVFDRWTASRCIQKNIGMKEKIVLAFIFIIGI